MRKNMNILTITVFILVMMINRPSLANYRYRRPISYAGPIVYSEEKPPVIQYPSPPAANHYKQPITKDYSYSHNISYVPLPFDGLPVLIYKTPKNKLPLYELKRQSQYGSQMSRYNNRHGSTWNGFNYPRNVNAYKNIANYGASGSYYAPAAPQPYFIPKSSISSTVYFPQVRPSNFNPNNNRYNYKSGSGSYYSGATKQQPPHIVYSGHPPIHVYQQPIVSSTMSYGKSLLNNNNHNFHAKMQTNVYHTPVQQHKPPIIIYQGVRPPVHVYNDKYTNPFSSGYTNKYSAKQGSQWEPVDKFKQIDNNEIKRDSFSRKDNENSDTVTADKTTNFVTETKHDQQISS